MWNELRKLTFFLFTGVTIVLVAALIIVASGCQQAPAPTPSETASTGPGATETVTITPETPTPTPEVSQTPTKQTELAPYQLSKGRRDPFVPFGTESAPPSKPIPTSTTSKPTTPGTTTAISAPVSAPQGPQSVPVQVTGTFVSGGKNWAILTSSAGGGPSFMVSSGDKVGEYVVKSVDPSKVVLVWSGKEYVIKMQSFGPNSTPKASGTTGETPKEKSLPAPEKPKGTQGQQPQMMPPPGGAPSGGGASGGGTGEGAKTETK